MMPDAEIEEEIRKRLLNRFGSGEYGKRNTEICLDRLYGTKYKDISERYGVSIERAREIFKSGQLHLIATMKGIDL